MSHISPRGQIYILGCSLGAVTLFLLKAVGKAILDWAIKALFYGGSFFCSAIWGRHRGAGCLSAFVAVRVAVPMGRLWGCLNVFDCQLIYFLHNKLL